MTIKVPTELAPVTGINAYSEAGAAKKKAFHTKGRALLKQLAAVLGPQLGEFSIRSNLGGVAVSGEVTLHADHLYVQLSESSMTPGLSMLFRSCSSQKDYCGNKNNFVSLADFANQGVQNQVLSTMQWLITDEIDRKADKARAIAA